MDTYADMLMEDLIECDVEETDGSNTSAAWTEQALDLFISQLKNVKKHTFSSDREMLQVVTNKMSHRSFPFSYNQIENKYNSLKKMYTEKREKNQSVEPELVKLFGDVKAASSKRQNSEEMLQSAKKTKVITIEDNSPNKTVDLQLPEDNDTNKKYWSNASVVAFLDLLEEYRPKLGAEIRTKKLMWEAISTRLKLKGFDISCYQVENKWKTLLRHYRNREEMLQKGESTSSGTLSKTPFPELYNQLKSMQNRSMHAEDSKISFANDQKLPFDDDGYDDEEPFRFEEDNALPKASVAEPIEQTSPDDNDTNKISWSHKSLITFLDLLEEYRPQLGLEIRTKKLMWEAISTRLKLKGFHITSSQVENKWKSLLRYYRNRQDMLHKAGSTNVRTPNKIAFPELYNNEFEDTKISFANDQKLPFDDDGYDDEEPFQFEEVCALPDINVSDPMNVEDVKVHRSEFNLPDLDENSSKMDKIVKELAGIRKDSKQYYTDSLDFKRLGLQAYRERTEQFTRIGDALTALMSHVKNRDGII